MGVPPNAVDPVLGTFAPPGVPLLQDVIVVRSPRYDQVGYGALGTQVALWALSSFLLLLSVDWIKSGCLEQPLPVPMCPASPLGSVLLTLSPPLLYPPCILPPCTICAPSPPFVCCGQVCNASCNGPLGYQTITLTNALHFDDVSVGGKVVPRVGGVASCPPSCPGTDVDSASTVPLSLCFCVVGWLLGKGSVTPWCSGLDRFLTPTPTLLFTFVPLSLPPRTHMHPHSSPLPLSTPLPYPRLFPQCSPVGSTTPSSASGSRTPPPRAWTRPQPVAAPSASGTCAGHAPKAPCAPGASVPGPRRGTGARASRTRTWCAVAPPPPPDVWGGRHRQPGRSVGEGTGV